MSYASFSTPLKNHYLQKKIALQAKLEFFYIIFTWAPPLNINFFKWAPHRTCCNKHIYLLKMLQSFYNVIEDQKYYYSDPLNRTFNQVHLNHSSCVPSLTRDACFGSQVSPIIGVPDCSFSVLDLGSHL